ncbi:MAG: 23S rRNA (uracil(1939)-C(5))-methyltransferase RlmD [Thermodesulfobacteriota bacterium]
MKAAELTIEKIVYGGWGMGRVEGKVIFVPYTIAGERVIVEIGQEKKNYAEAFLREIKEASSLRERPFCNLFGQCGSCHYQHLAYKEQLRIKEQMLKDFLAPLLNKDSPGRICSCLPSPEDRGYRIRAQLKGARKGGKQVWGFYERKSHQLVEIKECPLLHPLANLILHGIKEGVEKEAGSITIKSLEVQVSPEEGKGIICLRGVDDNDLDMFISYLLNYVPQLKGIMVKGKRNLTRGEMILEYQWPGVSGGKNILGQASYDSFIQVNVGVNRELIKKVLEWAELKGKERVLDLFCGSGNFTFPLGQIAQEVWGIDVNESAINLARQNAIRNGLINCHFMLGAAEEELPKLKKKIEMVEVVVLDPPRAGAGKKVLKLVVDLKPKKIIYVSCEPPTLVRDLKILGSWGYKLEKIQPLDMFPQTYHFETIASLVL